ncbi:MAG: cytochrome c, partial [Glaciimonas sp.]|nr:cytochrome c [Glaciimonas sp.]
MKLTSGVFSLMMVFVFASQGHAKDSAEISPIVTSGDQIKRGEYLARAADCIACHTVDKAKPFAGGYPLATPFGTIYGPNITPDK